MLIYDEQVVHLHLLSKGCLVRCCAAGEQLAGTHAAGQGLGHRKTGHILVLLGTTSCCTTKTETIGHQEDAWERRSSLDLRNGAHSLHQRIHWMCKAEAALLSNSINRTVYTVLKFPPQLLPEGDLCLHLGEKETT